LAVATEPILIAFGQPPRVAHNAALFCIWQIHGLPAIPILNSVNVYLQSQRIVRPSAVISIVANFGVTIPLCWFLSRPENLGYVGAPFAVACGQIAQASTQAIQLKQSTIRQLFVVNRSVF